MWRNLWMAAIAGAIAVSSPVQTAYPRTLDEILADGALRIGIRPGMPGMSMPDGSGGWNGFDIEIGKAVAWELGLEIEWVPVGLHRQAHFLGQDRVDIAFGALRRSAELAKLIDFTLPIHTEVLAVLVTGNVEGTGWRGAERKGRTNLGQSGSRARAWVGRHRPQVRYGFARTQGAIAELAVGSLAQTVIENDAAVHSRVPEFPEIQWRRAEEPLIVHYCAIGVAQGNANLLEVLNIIVHELHISDFIAEAWEKHHGAPMLYPVEPRHFY